MMNLAKKIFLLILLYFGLKVCEPSVLEQSAYRKSQDSQQNEHCICYVNDEILPLVSEKVETANFGFERLVVYFYKDMFTQKIAMYIPNPIKQYLIPDLYIESNDSLTYPSSSETIHDMVNARIQKTLTKGLYEHPGSTITSVDAIKSVNDESVSYAAIDWNSGKVEVDEQSVNIASPKDIFYNPIEDVQAPIIVQDDDANYLLVTSSEPINTNNDEIVKNLLNVVDMDIEHVIKTPDISFEQISTNNPFIPYKKESQSSSKYFEDNRNINKWIEQQILNMNSNLNTIDFESLRMLILKTLLENEINVTPDGLLTDAWGSLLDPSNLIIKPILLDSSVSYDRLLQNFVEAYIISQKNPPKVLGIIPSGKIYLPNSVRYSLVHDNKLIPSTVSEVNCLKGKCFSESSVDNTPLESPRLDYRIIPGILEEDEKMVTPNRRMNNYMYRPPVSKTTPNIEYPARNDRLMVGLKDDGELQTTLNLFPGISKTLATITKFLLQHGDKEVEKKENSLNIDEDGPGIRIIGGSAATGSGTPVSNKGRSGALHNNIEST